MFFVLRKFLVEAEVGLQHLQQVARLVDALELLHRGLARRLAQEVLLAGGAEQVGVRVAW